MIPAALLDDCRRLQEAVAPELSEDAPLYIFDADEIIGTPWKRNCLGWAGHGEAVNYTLREKFGSKWQGPGRFICLDGEKIQAAAQSASFDSCVLAVMTHEIGHLVPRQPVEKKEIAEPSAEVLELARLAVERNQAALPTIDEIDDVGHGPQFIRYTMHAWIRAVSKGFDVVMPSLALHAHPKNYLPLIVGEAVRMQHCTFDEIAATRIPRELVDTYYADADFRRKLRGL